MKFYFKLALIVIGIFLTGFIFAQVDSSGNNPGGTTTINWSVILSAALTILVPALYTFLVRVFPTYKNWDIIGQIINSIPNNRTDGGVHQ